MSPSISACLIVKNEETSLPGCLQNVDDVVDEIIVVDTGSTDRTMEIARNHGAKVYTHEVENQFVEARNVSFEKATSDWILWIDPDERLSVRLKDKLPSLIDTSEYSVIEIPLVDEMLRTAGHPPGKGRMSIFRKGHLTFEEPIGKPPANKKIKGNVRYVSDPIIHCQRATHSLIQPTKVLERSAKYAKDTPKEHSSYYYYFMAFWLFIRTFGKEVFFRKKYLDGHRGLKFALLISFRKFLINMFVGLRPKNQDIWKEWIDDVNLEYEYKY